VPFLNPFKAAFYRRMPGMATELCWSSGFSMRKLKLHVGLVLGGMVRQAHHDGQQAQAKA
jgi:hypothetical protein